MTIESLERAASRVGLWLLVGLLAVSSLLALLRSHRGEASTRWAEIDAANPRVAGVFHTLGALGLGAALDSLEHQAERDSLVLRSGHQLAHALGRQAFEYAGRSDTVIAHCRPDFGSGCYHGVVEASLHHDRRVDMAELEQMCGAREPEAHPGSLFECVHGVGHGILSAVDGDVSRALHYCDELSTNALRGSCHEGVFMEAITGAVAGPAHHMHDSLHAGHNTGLVLQPGDPYSPCRGYEGEYGQACWIFQGYVILRTAGFDAAQALHICDRAPVDWIVRCYQSVGHQLTGLFQRDGRWVIDRCRSGQPELGSQCAGGAVIALVAEDWSGRRALAFCREVPASWQDACRGVYQARMTALRSQSQLR